MKKIYLLLIIIFCILVINFIFLTKIKIFNNNLTSSNFFLFKIYNYNYFGHKKTTIEESNFVSVNNYPENLEIDKYLFTNSKNYIYSSIKNPIIKSFDFSKISYLRKYFIYNHSLAEYINDNCEITLYGTCLLEIKDKITSKFFYFKKENFRFIYLQTQGSFKDYKDNINIYFIKKNTNKILEVKINYLNSWQFNFKSKNYIIIDFDEYFKKDDNNSGVIIKVDRDKDNKKSASIKNIFLNDTNYPINVFNLNTQQEFNKAILGINKTNDPIFAKKFCNEIYNECSYYNIIPQSINYDDLIQQFKKDLNNQFENLNIKLTTHSLVSSHIFYLAINLSEKLKLSDLNNVINKNKTFHSLYEISSENYINFYNSLFYTNLIIYILFLYIFFIFTYKNKFNKYHSILVIFFLSTFIVYNLNLNFVSLRLLFYHFISINFIFCYLLFKLLFKNIFLIKFKYYIITILLISDFLIFNWTQSLYFFTFYILIDLILFLLKQKILYDKKR